jgi:transposase
MPQIRSRHVETNTAEPQPGFQGKSGLGGDQKPAPAEAGGEQTLAELAQLYEVHPTQVTSWKAQLLGGAAGLFGSGSPAKDAAPAEDLKTLHAKIGELTLENDFLVGALGKAGLLSARR